MSNARILIVEDELIVAQDLKNRLHDLGYTVAGSVANGPEAIALADQLRPDLVLMDIRLEGEMDGIVVAERIRRDFRLPVVFLTAYSEDTTLERAKTAESFGYILKPFEDRELKTHIEMALYKARADEEICRLQRLYATISQINQTIVRVRSRQELFQAIVRIALEFGRFKAARLDEYDSQGQMLMLLAEAGKVMGSRSWSEPIEGLLPCWAPAVWEAARKGTTSLWQDAFGGATTDSERAWAAQLGIRSFAAVPFCFKGEVCGVLSLAAGEPGFFQEAEVKLVEETALDISFALDQFDTATQRERAEIALQQRVEELGMLSILGRTVNATLSLEQIAKQSLAGMLSVVRPDMAFLFLRDGDQLVLEEVQPPAARLQLGLMPEHRVGECMCGLAVQEKKPLYSLNIFNDPRCTWQECKKTGLRSFAALPLLNGGEVIGVLGLASAEERDFERQDGFLETLASQVSIALANARLYESARHELAERRRIEESLRQSESNLRQILDSAAFGIIVVGQDKVIRHANKTAIEMAGFESEEEMKGIVCHQHVCPAEAGKCPILDLLEPVNRSERVLLTKHGKAVSILKSVVPIVLNGEKVLLESFVDITDRQRAEQDREKLQVQLLQAQKMESVGRLAGGVAHDFNNMLQAILGNTMLALQDLPSDSPVRDNLEEIQQSAERSAGLTRQLLAFARKQTIVPKVLDLNNTVASMLKMLRRIIGEDIDLAWLPGANLWPIRMDPSQIDQVLANLCVNARDAIANTGKVTIETDNVVLDDAFAASHQDCAPGSYIMLAVSDTGQGMDANQLAHLFEPFFTTKELGKGTGLGLATVFGIVKQNGGAIHVYSKPEHGTTIKIYLPRAEASAETKSDTVTKVLHGSETVLLVEDEKQILSLGQRILEQRGYSVLVASTPEAALKQATEHGGPIHLLITDVVMPTMNGKELYAQLQAQRPKLKCLYMSGYTADVIARHGVLDKGVHFLQKPFSVQALGERIRDILVRQSDL
jgi:PAS domain S-box-containing protein